MNTSLDLRKFDAVVAPDGRIGMIHAVYHTGQVVVQFGADGPFQSFRAASLRWATRDEVRADGKEGVGGLTVRIGRTHRSGKQPREK
jgi:hypothetical protein